MGLPDLFRRSGASSPPEQPPYSAALHAVRKHGRRSEPPSPLRIYRVHPRGFRQLVQRLTGATRPLRETVAPPPLPQAGMQPLSWETAPPQFAMDEHSYCYTAVPNAPPPPPQQPTQTFNYGFPTSSGGDDVRRREEDGIGNRRGEEESVGFADFPSPTLYSAYSAWSPGKSASKSQVPADFS